MAGLPSPSKAKVNEFISPIFQTVDSDNSGEIEVGELKGYIDMSMEIQNFLLRYSGVQTIERAKKVFRDETTRW